MAVSILSALTIIVIPKFKEVFSEMTGSANLPAFTEFVLNSSDFIKRHLVIFVAVVAGLIVAFRFFNRMPPGRAVIDRAKLRLPVVGRIIRKVAIARFARTLGTMLQNGVPVLQALTIARDTTSNVMFARAIQHIHERVKDGDTITSPLQSAGVFPSTVVSMIDIGEQTGALPNMLLKVADNYEEEVDASIAAALSLLEPALIIFLAVVVGSIVIALFLPIADMIDRGGIDPNRGME
jgi:type IV pilus assembly protein PilC